MHFIFVYLFTFVGVLLDVLWIVAKNFGASLKIIGISRVHLHRKLKELTNQSTRDFIRNIRLKQAAELLSQKHLNITEVAYVVGFNNLVTFSIAFKQIFGVSPKAYMEHHKKEELKQ